MTYSKLRFQKIKNFVSRSPFGELQLTQISLNFQTFCRNFKIKGMFSKVRAHITVVFFLTYTKILWTHATHAKISAHAFRTIFFSTHTTYA